VEQPRIQQIHPPFYFLHFCPHCYYTDIVEDFETPDHNDYTRWSLKCFKDARKDSDPTIDLLGSGVHYDEIGFDSAMRIHLLAVYTQLLSPPDVLDCYKIGRLLLRIAWLHREQTQKAIGAQAPETASANGSPSTDVRDTVLKGFSDSEQLAFASSTTWSNLNKAIIRDVESRFDEHAIPFKAEMDDVSALVESLISKVKTAKTAYLHHVAHEEHSVEERSISTEYSMDDPTFMEKLQLMWPLAPGDEREAMRASIRYLEKALSSDPRFDSMDAYFSVASLSVDLLMRCGEIDSAFGFVRGIHSSCMETRQVYTEKLKEPGIKPDRKKKIQVLMKRNNATMDCALDLRSELMLKLVERERPRIEGILKKHLNRSGKAVEEALVTAGIPNGIINFIDDPKNKVDLAPALHRK
jgi:hypothetical protein